jgi:hypothetical protein
MISLREILYGLYGAYRLCRFDPQGLGYLDRSHEGFWRSFFAAVLVAPAHFLIIALRPDAESVRASLPRIVLIEGAAYVILVFAYPVIMHAICQFLDRQRQYVSYIVAYNWAGAVQMALVFPMALITTSGLLPTPAANLLQLAVTALTLVMFWYIAKTALEIPGHIAAVLVTIDVVLSYLLGAIADARLGIA